MGGTTPCSQAQEPRGGGIPDGVTVGLHFPAKKTLSWSRCGMRLISGDFAAVWGPNPLSLDFRRDPYTSLEQRFCSFLDRELFYLNEILPGSQTQD